MSNHAYAYYKYSITTNINSLKNTYINLILKLYNYNFIYQCSIMGFIRSI